jgi:hypothetical protein
VVAVILNADVLAPLRLNVCIHSSSICNTPLTGAFLLAATAAAAAAAVFAVDSIAA